MTPNDLIVYQMIKVEALTAGQEKDGIRTLKQLVENEDSDGGGGDAAGGVGGGGTNANAKMRYVRETCAQGTCPLSHFHKR
ncbi:hypothetical protein HZH68_009805 [Vespula germanica]|uniref:Uncharacterized protein n=1 Tax=Vespula germanica TaxID=30212 RepID=A0A834JX53_VESGE|nr:hypothetical protein HZH68_009805 [Vespula germanica]